MKNLVVSLVVIFLSFTCFTQIIEVNFNEHFGFSNPTKSTDYFKVVNEDSLFIETMRFGENKYIIDLNKKTVDFYYQESLYRKTTIDKVDVKNGLVLIRVNDIDVTSKDSIYVYFVINQSKDNNNYPYFTFYYESDNMIKGYIVMDNMN